MNSSTKRKGGLGKGLSALLENAATDITSKKEQSAVLGSISMLKIENIEANPFNPRTHFEEHALNELSNSIAAHGIIQPITVRKLGNDRFQLISGERRFKASQLAGLTEVPAYIRVANDQSMLEMALVENIQREDLNAIEVALSYQRLIEECDLTQEQMSQKIAKSRTSITNHLRLLKLPVLIQMGVRDGKISMGHARAIVSAGDEVFQLSLFNKTIENQLSVRELELMIRDGVEIEKPSGKKIKPSLTPLSSVQQTFCFYMTDKLASRVDIKKTSMGTGKVTISFDSDVDLNRIIELLNK
jgi:ParB family chromosome partitioning protein